MKTKKSNFDMLKYNKKKLLLFLLQLFIIFIFIIVIIDNKKEKSSFNIKILITQMKSDTMFSNNLEFFTPTLSKNINVSYDKMKKHLSNDFFGNIYNIEKTKKKITENGCNTNLSDFNIYILHSYVSTNYFQDEIRLDFFNSTKEIIKNCINSLEIVINARFAKELDLIILNYETKKNLIEKQRVYLSNYKSDQSFLLDYTLYNYNLLLNEINNNISLIKASKANLSKYINISLLSISEDKINTLFWIILIIIILELFIIKIIFKINLRKKLNNLFKINLV